MATSLVDSRKAISPSMSFSEDDAPSPEAAPAEDEDDDDDAERAEVKLTFLFLLLLVLFYSSLFHGNKRTLKKRKERNETKKNGNAEEISLSWAHNLIDGMLATPMRAIRVDPF